MRGRVVYSTGEGRVCPRCGWPENGCRCSSGAETLAELVPARATAKLRIEKQGRGGKTVTVIDGLPRNAAWVEDLAREMKRACGTGGTAGAERIELQGDVREKLRPLLERRGLIVKG